MPPEAFVSRVVLFDSLSRDANRSRASAPALAHLGSPASSGACTSKSCASSTSVGADPADLSCGVVQDCRELVSEWVASQFFLSHADDLRARLSLFESPCIELVTSLLKPLTANMGMLASLAVKITNGDQSGSGQIFVDVLALQASSGKLFQGESSRRRP